VSTGTGVALYADDVRVADGSVGDDPDAPTALSGLSVQWGRATTVDQPDPSICSFDLMDAPGGDSFADAFTVGTPVKVTATGVTYPPATVPSWTDPGFETDPPATTTHVNTAPAVSTRRAHAGTHALKLAPVNGAAALSAVLAPAPFAAAGTDPGAWDAIPATAPGQMWSYGAWVYAPPDTVVTIRPVLFTGPYATAGTVLSGRDLTAAGTGAWVHLAGILPVSVTGAWVGLFVQLAPPAGGRGLGYRWADVPPAITWDTVAVDATWEDYATAYVDDVGVLAPAGGQSSTVLVFAGRVTDLAMAWDDAIGGPVVKVSASDFTADLANVYVGDQPWLAEPMAARFNRILGLTGLGVTAAIDARPGAIPVSWLDVDHQAAAGLLRDLAASTDAVMWSATHQVTGPYLDVEDPSARVSGHTLAMVGGVVVIVDAAAGFQPLSGCDLIREPITWTQSVADIITRADVTWLAEGLDGDGQVTTTEATESVVSPDREVVAGVRRLGLSTVLRTATDAHNVASAVLARTGQGWRADGLTVDDAPDPTATPAATVAALLALLDGTSRNGRPLRLIDLPGWAPGAPALGVYLEGGRYTFADGRWVLELIVSDASFQGGSVTWGELDPAWRWADLDPAMTWADLVGVGPPLT
jgi:hypothetical protein